MSMELSGTTVVLTGACGGIGSAIASRLAARGARLVLVGRSIARVRALAAELPAVARKHLPVEADIATPDGRALLRGALALLGASVQALVNAAGTSHFALLSDTPPQTIEDLIATNVTAPVLVTQLLLPFLDPAGARILNIGSGFGGIGFPGFSAYCASKFALRGFGEALRRELSDGAIQVATLAPRATRTPLNSAAVDAMNAALGHACDPPVRVAREVERMLSARTMRDRAIGWPERFFLRLNALFPSLVDAALRRKLPTIKRFAGAPPAPADASSRQAA